MKKIKQLNLLQTKEKLNQRKTISHLVDLKDEAAKCQKVGQELEEITKQKMTENNEVTAYSFQAIDNLCRSLWSSERFYPTGRNF